MSIQFYMDVHVPMSVTDGLRRRGIDVLTSQEDGTTDYDDRRLLKRAHQLGRVLITQDNDFLEIGAQLQGLEEDFVGIVYVHQLGMGIGEMIEELRLIADCADHDEVANRVIFLPLK